MPARSTRLRDLVRSKRSEILALAERHGARDLALFGSVARGEADETSDLDLLVSFDEGRSLFDHVGLQQDLEDLLGIRVDVVSRAALSPYIREALLREAVAV